MNAFDYHKKFIDFVMARLGRVLGGTRSAQKETAIASFNIENIAQPQGGIAALRLAHEDEVRKLIRTPRLQAPP